MTTKALLADDPAPAFLQLAGHPLRWKLLSELSRSDRKVHELTARTGEAQNLVSYHLGKLRDVAMVSTRRSAADRRDTYYGLDLDRIGGLLSAAGAGLHPGLRLTPAPRVAALPRPARVLFLCTGNSARSPMAAALAGAMSGGTVLADSAGSHPRPVHPNAVRVMRERHGLDLSGHTPIHLDAFVGQFFDAVISACDRVREVCPAFPGAPEPIHWSLANPATGEDDALTYPLFLETASELATRIAYLLARLADRPRTP